MTRFLLTLGTFLCLQSFCGPARAETTTERALAILCGTSATYLAPHVDEAALAKVARVWREVRRREEPVAENS